MLVDKKIWNALWRWATRRHPEKGNRWIKNKYFKTEENRNWVFAVDANFPDGEARRVRLLIASDTPIQRHIKIRGDANPFDPAYEAYFENRLDWKNKEEHDRTN